jgi:hypothetical protein
MAGIAISPNARGAEREKDSAIFRLRQFGGQPVNAYPTGQPHEG